MSVRVMTAVWDIDLPDSEKIVLLALADCADDCGHRSKGYARNQAILADPTSRARFQPAVIPGPTDSRWIDVLVRWPELQPALSAEEAESHLCRGIDAMAHRVERLRATGNGVDPVVAGSAFLLLASRLGLVGSRHAATQPVPMTATRFIAPTPTERTQAA